MHAQIIQTQIPHCSCLPYFCAVLIPTKTRYTSPLLRQLAFLAYPLSHLLPLINKFSYMYRVGATLKLIQVHLFECTSSQITGSLTIKELCEERVVETSYASSIFHTRPHHHPSGHSNIQIKLSHRLCMQYSCSHYNIIECQLGGGGLQKIFMS